jgi:uridylate kinase
MKYNRVLLKLSGEALMGKEGYGVDPNTLADVSSQIADVRALGVEIAVVIGGGNIYRGMRAEKQGIDRTTGDYMGMIATLLNVLALQDTLGRKGVGVTVQSALEVKNVVEPYARKKAIADLEAGNVILFACGTGNPYFTTDTAAALRALEINAGVLLKATRVDGIYDKDPEVHKDALFFREISYMETIERNLRVMDMTAITLCMENELPIVVFNIKGKDNMKRIVLGEEIGSIVRR